MAAPVSSVPIWVKKLSGQFEIARNEMTPTWAESISMDTGEDGPEVKFQWLLSVPGFQKFMGERSVAALTDEKLEIISEIYERTLEIPKDDIMRDQLGQHLSAVSQLAQRANQLWNKLTTEAIIGGETTPCFTGSYFFDNNHIYDGADTPQSNVHTFSLASVPTNEPKGTATDPSAAVLAWVITKAIEKIHGWVDRAGEPVNEHQTSFQVHVPLRMRGATNTALRAQYLGHGVTNDIENQDFSVNPVGNTRLNGWGNQFCIFVNGGNAFIRHDEFINDAFLGEGSDYWFQKRAGQWSIEMSRNLVYGDPAHAHLVKLVA